MDLDLIEGDEESLWKKLEPFLDKDKEKIRKSFDFACLVHKNQKRESGQKYICHPVWVAKIVAQMKLGPEAIMAALLHDCIEDSPTKIEEIAKKFGDEVALLVDGLTEVRKKTHGIEIHEKNIQAFRRFLFSSVNDVRILMIRLVDKLHNGLTIGYLSPERQKKYAKRVLGIYGPVAEYVGMHYFKKRLDDIAFEILYPKEAGELKRWFAKRKKVELKSLVRIRREIRKMLKINHIKGVKIQGRIKSLYSTYKKMEEKGKDRVKDRIGLRVLTKSTVDCYTILGLLHSKYAYLYDEFDDYISTPKPSGYRSLQTTLKWKEGVTAEIQIRTYDMHDFNEFGPASHIAYKYGSGSLGGGYEWVRDLVAWQNGEKGVNNYRINVLTKYIYVFTPKGDTIQLPCDCTALDFAYRIHSGLGNRCVGAKINQKMAKIDSKLKTGDMVEILKSKKVNVSKNWLEMVKMSASKEKIRRALTEKSDTIKYEK